MPLEAHDTPGVQVRVQLLAGFSVAVQGHLVPHEAWPARRAADLVQLLALSDRHRLVADRVVESLWPHLPPDAGAANLRKAAHHARRALGDTNAIVLRGGTVALFPTAHVSVDAAEFEAMADAALRTGDPARCAEAVEPYRGGLLPESPYEEWGHVPRRRLRDRYLRLLRASAQWERLVEAEPLEEEAYRELMTASLESGDAHAAIRWYGRLRTALLTEIGMAPSRQTDRVYDRCVAALGSGEPVFVGRDVELARATAALRRAGGGGGPATVLVRGPAGIGKSAFCRRLVAGARADGWLPIVTESRERGVPYAPLTAIVEELVLRDRRLLDAVTPRARAVLAALTPVARPADDVGGALTRHGVIGAMRQLLAAASDAAGAVVVIDDAHVADEATIDGAFQLAVAGDPPIVVVVAYRPEHAPTSLTRVVDRLSRGERATVIDLDALDEDESVALVTASATRRLGHEELSRIVELGDGHPFLLVELARHSPPDDARARSVTVWEAVRRRFVDLDDATTAVLQRLALAGDEFDLPAVQALTGLDDDEAYALLDAVLAAGVLVVAGDRYRFRHALVRQALTDQLPPHQRIAVHRDAARRLGALGAPAPVVAGHWLAGRRPDDAMPWLLAAARQALALGAHLDAVGHLDVLLGLVPDVPEALVLRAEALDALGDVGAPAAYAAAATANDDQADDLRAKQALAQLKLGDPAGALATAEGLAPGTLHGRLALALTYSGAAAIGFADPALGTAKAAEGRRLAIQSGDSAAIIVASWAHAAAAHARGELRASVRADLAETAALPTLATTVFDGQLCITQRLLYGARSYGDVIAFADALAAEARRLRAARGHAFAVTLRGEAELLSGQLDAADVDLVHGADLHRSIGGATGEALALQRRAEVALHRGQVDHAVLLIEDALAVARESDVGFHLLDRIYGTKIAAAVDARTALATLEDAEAAVRGPVETCPGCRITFAVPAAIAAARAGDVDRATSYAEATEMLATVVMRLPAWHAALEEVRGHLAIARGSPAAARRHFEAAAAGFADAGQPLDRGRCTQLASAIGT